MGDKSQYIEIPMDNVTIAEEEEVRERERIRDTWIDYYNVILCIIIILIILRLADKLLYCI